ncbi:SpaA isopeptide-forming pilin-related protein [Candidatus Enterococcus leclercqii]|uniref:SpaA isopeptide-forming pilin-related protein n=1 Tax=Candidatus Enterococcus leclercqii TaxID=1857218 RepID=UPI00137A04E7|nr:SpaA isopeptide-forming pilin-related protein [Enterococcus sp. CU9D]KAF1293720.1 hypothetical protein BAU14_13980 [Enterococcus sp. CU9D]
MKMKKSLLSGFLILAMLIPYFTDLLTIFPLGAEAAETGIQLVKTDELAVTADYQEGEGEDATGGWQLRYEKTAEGEQTQRLKFKLGESKVFAEQDNWGMEGDWFVETAFGGSAIGEVFIPAEATEQIQVSVQLDVATPQEATETTTTEATTTTTTNTTVEILPLTATADPLVTEDVLDETVSGPHVLGPDDAVDDPVNDATDDPADGDIVDPVDDPADPAGTDEVMVEGTNGTTEDKSNTVTGQGNNIGVQQTLAQLIGPVERSYPTYVNKAPTYTTEDNGATYPTNSWIPTDGNGDADENVINHRGGSNTETGWDDKDAWNGDPRSENSYIKYYDGDREEPDFQLRKFAKESDTQGLFDVYLNVKGNIQQEMQPMDIVLVADWSASMAEKDGGRKRIDELKAGVNAFTKALSESGENITNNIRLGFVPYASDVIEKETVNLQSFKEAKEAIDRLEYNTVTHTFTQAGLKKAREMLDPTDDEEVRKKVIVLLTDGVPTRSYQITPDGYNSEGGYGVNFNYRTIKQTGSNTSKLSKDNEYDVNGSGGREITIDSTFPATIGEAMLAKGEGIEIHGLGILLQSDSAAGLNKNAVENKFRQMVSANPSDQADLYYESAEKATDISNYLINKAIQLIGTVSNGSIVDPLGKQFIYVEDSLKVTVTAKTGYPTPGSPNVVPYNENTRTLNISDINLSKGQELQIHYRVRINTESETFVPDTWYQMNGETTLTPNGGNSTNKVNFGVPSGKAPGTKIKIQKVWEEYDDDKNGRKDLYFRVQRDKTDFAIAKLQKTNADIWQQTYTKLSEIPESDEEIQKSYDETLYLPKFDNEGNDFTYTVVEELDTPEGYEATLTDQDDGFFQWKNTKIFTRLDLEVTKKSDQSKATLVGAKFTLSGGDLEKAVILKGNDDGTYTLPEGTSLDKGQTYTLTEIQAPTGHTLSDSSPWKIVVKKDGTLDTTSSKGISIVKGKVVLTVVNEFTPVSVQAKKVSATNDSTPLEGATFSLSIKDDKGEYEKLATSESGENGLALFADSIKKPGTYKLTETAGPAGYDTVAGDYVFTVDAYGQIAYKGINYEEVSGIFTFTHANELKPFDLTILKQSDYDKKALEGATFAVSEDKAGTSVLATATSGKDGKVTFDYAFEPGTYYLKETEAPEGFHQLTGTFTLIIGTDGSATLEYEGEEYQEGFDLSLKGSTEHNQLSFTVDNTPKVPLPKTGGQGRGIFFISAMVLLAMTGWYFYKKETDTEKGGRTS